MVQGYYTLEEAAQILGMSTDELKQISKRGELRAFQDRGTLRFRTQEVEELARQRGGRSNPDLPLGEAPPPRPADSPAPRGGAKKGKEAEVFDFSLDTGDDQVEIGQEILGEGPSGGRKSSSGKKSGPSSPSPKPGSDSDVRLVSEGGELGFNISSDSDVKMVDDVGPKSMPPMPKSPSKIGPRKTGAHMDSGVRLVDLDPDSDVKIVGADESTVSLGRQPPRSATDSDVRLEAPSRPPAQGSDDALLTEEIDLDAEIRKHEEEAARAKSDPSARPQPRARQPEFPTTSPFELSEADLHVTLPEEGADAQVKQPSESSDMLLTPGEDTDSSSDFDLTPAGAKSDSSDFDLTPSGGKSDSSDFELTPSGQGDLGSDEFQLEVADDSEVGLGELPSVKGPTSGINLKDPADSGISLEQGGDGSDEIEFELSLDAEATPKPEPAAAEADSDSEFELTIDETGGLAPLEEETPAVEEEKDIFETDFDVPALEDESGSQAMALDEADTDLDSSDFDIALSSDDMAAEDESGSQVVALEDEEEAEDGAKTIQRPIPKKRTVMLDDEDEGGGLDDLLGGDLETEPEEDEEEEAPAVGGPVVAPAPEWSAVSVLLMIPAALVLLLVAIMGFEMLQGVMGYHKPGMLTKQIGKLLGAPMPKD